jgi:hypothetical protein
MRSRFLLVFALVILALLPLAAQEITADAEPAPVEELALEETSDVEAAPAEESTEAAAPVEAVPVEVLAIEAPADVEAAPAEESAAEPTDEELIGELNWEVYRLGIELEEANAVIDELRSEVATLEGRAEELRALAESERAAAEEATAEAEAARATTRSSDESAAWAEEKYQETLSDLEAAASAHRAEAAELEAKAADLEARIAWLELARETEAVEVVAAELESWGDLRLDPASYPEVLRKGFDGGESRMGTWKIAGGVAEQTDGAQYFSRLTFPLVQSEAPTLYSFEVKAGPKGWVGAGLHFFAEGVRKTKGYGEGRSLLVWLTRDAKMRGDEETYLQIYRSDDDVNMERVLDAEVKEDVSVWNRLDILYEPASEFVVIAVNGSVRTAYRTFFGIGSGVSVSLRTLGSGVSFRNFEVRR